MPGYNFLFPEDGAGLTHCCESSKNQEESELICQRASAEDVGKPELPMDLRPRRQSLTVVECDDQNVGGSYLLSRLFGFHLAVEAGLHFQRCQSSAENRHFSEEHCPTSEEYLLVRLRAELV